METQYQTFIVTAQETDGCFQHGFSGTYRLRIGVAIAQLIRCKLDEEVTSWPLHLIRKFGYTAQTFFLYAGTRCKTGEGRFNFYTLEGKKIVQCMTLQIAQIQNQQINKKDKEGIEGDMHTGKMQHKSKKQAVNTSSDRGHSGPEAHRITESGYSEPANFLLPSFAKSKHTTSVEYSKVMESKDTRPNFQSSLSEHGHNYNNWDLYSHLNRDGSCTQENVYGMASASAALKSSEECVDDTNSSTYEYVA